MENDLKGLTAKDAREKTIAIKYDLFIWRLIYKKINEAIEKGEFNCDITVDDIVDYNPNNITQSKEQLIKQFIGKVDKNLILAGYRTTQLANYEHVIDKVLIISW